MAIPPRRRAAALPATRRYDYRPVRPVTNNVYITEERGRYRIRWREHGKLHSESVGTREEAEEKAAFRRLDLLRRVRDPFSEAREVFTVGELAARWYNEAIQGSDAKPGTVTVYERHLGLVLETSIASHPAHALTTARVNRWLRTLDHTDATVRNMLVVLSSIFQHALSEGLGDVSSNPVRGAKRPKQQRLPVQIPSNEEVLRLAITVPFPEPSWRALLTVCAYAGLRQQEAFALRWMDVEDTHVHVHRAVSGDKGEITTTKTEKGQRRVPLMPLVRDAFAVARSDEWQPDPEDLIWQTATGRPWNRSTFQANIWNAWRTNAGVNLKWRHLRHYFASQLAASGGSALLCSRMMGHTKFSFTMDTYGFLFEEDIGPVFDAMQQRVFGS